MQTGEPSEPVTIAYYRVTSGETHVLGPRLTPSNSVLIVAPGTESAPNLERGKALARETMRRLAKGEIVAEERSYVLPPKPERIATIDHSEKMLQAVILRWPDSYEVRIVGYVPNGYTLPVATPSFSNDLEYEWGQLDLFERILTDSFDEARAATQEELARHAASDAPIRLREK